MILPGLLTRFLNDKEEKEQFIHDNEWFASRHGQQEVTTTTMTLYLKAFNAVSAKLLQLSYVSAKDIDYQFPTDLSNTKEVDVLSHIIAVKPLNNLILQYARNHFPGEIPLSFSLQNQSLCERLSYMRILNPVFSRIDNEWHYVFCIPGALLYLKHGYQSNEYGYPNIQMNREFAADYELLFGEKLICDSNEKKEKKEKKENKEELEVDAKEGKEAI